MATEILKILAELWKHWERSGCLLADNFAEFCGNSHFVTLQTSNHPYSAPKVLHHQLATDRRRKGEHDIQPATETTNPKPESWGSPGTSKANESWVNYPPRTGLHAPRG